MSEHPNRPLVDEVLATRIHGRRSLVHAREQSRDDHGRVRIFLTGEPAVLPHLAGMRVATRTGERLELRELRLLQPPAEPGERPEPAQAALALGYPVEDGAQPTRRETDGPRSTSITPTESSYTQLGARL